MNSRISNLGNIVNAKLELTKTIANTYLAKQLRSSGHNDSIQVKLLQTHIEYIQSGVFQSNQKVAVETADIGIWNYQGKIIANTNHELVGREQDINLLNRAKKESVFFTGYQLDKHTNKYYVMMFAAIYNHSTDSFAGCVVLKISPESITKILTRQKGLSQNISFGVFYMSGDSLIINTENRNAGNNESTNANRIFKTILEKGEDSTGQIAIELDHSILVSKFLPVFNWGIYASIPTSEAYAPINSIRDNTILALLLACLFSLLFGFLASKPIALKANTLVSVFERTGRGEITELPVYKSNDEFTELAAAAKTTVQYIKDIIVYTEEIGKENYEVGKISRSNSDKLGIALDTMVLNLKTLAIENKKNLALQNSVSELTRELSNEVTIEKIAEKSLHYLATHTQSQVGVFYYKKSEDKKLHLAAGYGLPNNNNIPVVLQAGEGISGEAMKDKKPICKLPRN